MTTTQIMPVVALIVATGWALQAAWAQRTGITRADLQRRLGSSAGS